MDRFRYAVSGGLIVALLFALLTPIPPRGTFAQTNTPGANTDPCQSSLLVKSSASINITSATTSALVALSGTKAVYVCDVNITILGLATTAGTIQFGYSTVAACASSVTALTGTIQGTTTAGSTIAFNASGGSTQFTAPSANGLCVTTTGTSPGFQGYVTYVQI